ncbi:HlyD family secretion protein [Arachidicoccus soli]|uniref:HlyD family efflux transporter periplasmic adaptor subunit n=1 Tax=Arachidicoccus soli TaxID=2341117 RepID=A0A386HSY4_9BACT|nr:HlyD family efflux transporter periplasmic adaptor subunit [Arachidicoccus soli]AYD49047.1 HlyD family efflux transporter periplasmic adaptor subunit [Arachidicoccus soli]
MEQNTNQQVYHNHERTEEVQEIIDRMPTKFGRLITYIVILIFVLLIFFGWLIRYPDVVAGQITVNTNVSPLKLVAMSSGKLRLKIHKSQTSVKEGDIIAYIENITSPDTLETIRHAISDYNPLGTNNTSILQKLPQKADLGDVTDKYYAFIENVHQLKNIKYDKSYEDQIEGLNFLLQEQQKSILVNNERIGIARNNMSYTHKFFFRDSLLFKEKVVSEAELDQTQLNYLNSKDNYQTVYTNQIGALQNAKQTQTQINQARIQMREKKKELELAVISSYNALKDNINTWGQNYIFKAPFSGKVQFLGFWTNGQFIQSGQSVFTVIPEDKQVYGQVILPAASGAGKVKIGQEVIIKLDNFPYLEYGTIRGKVSAISLTTNTESTSQGNVETYLVTVGLPKGLTTNYGKQLNFKQESKGTAEIVTKDRRLIERFFDGLKYIIKN